MLVFSNIGANKSIFYHFLAQECFLKDPLPHQENDAGGTPQAPAGDCDGLLYRRPAPAETRAFVFLLPAECHAWFSPPEGFHSQA